ncbi:MAG: S-methyl-5'-thioadenosine phosphorylase [Elusimicrobia bacterium]|nr:S-methyl-5'-thioadenosine phosphorylase [Elusimicrobiota bacterium]MBU2614296.1 S-methyl-5'-thioadenosine phosphorylase [Elusimicrobiota bacterium]
MVKIGIIGGSGVYHIDGLTGVKEIAIKTPFGNPSDKIVLGTLQGRRVAFLPRHGKGHRILPAEVNSQANIYALKSLGVEHVISISACGSLKEELKPRDFVIPDQIFDRTRLRRPTFFGNGLVAHIEFAEPYCKNLRKLAYDCLKEAGANVHFGGTYVCIEGPQFSTKAESEVNRKLEFSVVGMTALPEAKLAREAEMCYVTVAAVTDYDVWKEGEEVSSDMVIGNLNANVNNVKNMLKILIPRIPLKERICKCSSTLKYAIFTSKEKANKATVKKLDLLIGKYWR